MEKNKKDQSNKKAAFIILLICSLLFTTMGIAGTIKKFYDIFHVEPPVVERKKEFQEDGNLNYYIGDKLYTYECKYTYCDSSFETMDDAQYGLKIFNDGTINYVNQIVNNRYVFITDGNSKKEDNYHYGDGVNVYDLFTKKVVKKYKSIKNYSTELSNNSYIFQDENDKWGVVSFKDGEPKTIIDFKYDYIGVSSNDKTNNLIDMNDFTVMNDGKWKVIDVKTGEDSSVTYDIPIYNVLNNVVVLNDGKSFVIKSKEGNDISTNIITDLAYSKNNYIIGYSNSYIYTINTIEGKQLEPIYVSYIDELYAYDENNSIIIIANKGAKRFTITKE